MPADTTNAPSTSAPTVSEQTTVRPAPASSGDEPQRYNTVDDAMAELERRDQARRAARKAEREAKAQADKGEGDDADDGEEQGRKPAKRVDKLARDMKVDEPDEEDDDQDDDDDRDEDRDDKDEADDDGDEDGTDDEGDDGDDSDERDEATDDEGDDRVLKKAATVEIDGKAYEIPAGTPREVVEATQRLARDLKADYTRKTQSVAEAVRQVQARDQQAEQLLQTVTRAQQAVYQMAQQIVGSPPPLELAQSDPQSYLVQKGLYEQRMAQLQGLMSQGNALQTQQQARQQQAMRRAVQEEAQKVLEKMPHLGDPATRKQFVDAATSVVGRFGFQPDEIAGITDHRAMLMINRLIELEFNEWRRQQAAGNVKDKLKNVPPRPVKSATGTKDNSTRSEKAKRDFMRSKRTMSDVKRYLAATER
jgi:hypothetical protein